MTKTKKMGSLSSTKTCKLARIYFFLSFVPAIQVSGFQHKVGDEKGWIKPHGRECEMYNQWAQKHRFQVGDSLYFRYTNDSVLQVDREDYEDCSVHNPISRFENEQTVFIFYRQGFFYFISGKPGHCQAGQKMVIRVMVQFDVRHLSISSPAPSPLIESPTVGGEEGNIEWNNNSWSFSTLTNSTDMLSSVTTYVLNMFMGAVIVLHVFMD